MKERDYLVAPIDHLVEVVRKETKVDEPQVWTCPCGDPECVTRVVYANDGTGRVHFLCTVTFQVDPPWSLYSIENVEDFGVMLHDKEICPDDRGFYAAMFEYGLKRTLLEAL